MIRSVIRVVLLSKSGSSYFKFGVDRAVSIVNESSP